MNKIICVQTHLIINKRNIKDSFNQTPGGAETSCVCVSVPKEYVKFTVPKVCTVGIYNTYESWYLYSLGEYICLLLIVYLKISLIIKP